MFLQVWLQEGNGTIVFIPYGRLLIVPGVASMVAASNLVQTAIHVDTSTCSLVRYGAKQQTSTPTGQSKRISGSGMRTKVGRSTKRQVTNYLIGDGTTKLIGVCKPILVVLY
jgi:hypothetical protein